MSRKRNRVTSKSWCISSKPITRKGCKSFEFERTEIESSYRLVPANQIGEEDLANYRRD